MSRVFDPRNGLTGTAILVSYLVGVVFALPDTAAAAEASSRSLTLEVQSPVFAKKGAIEILDSDIDAFLKLRVPPEDRPTVLQSEQRVGRIIESLIRTNALYDAALSANLLNDPDVQESVLYSAARQLANVYQQHLADEIELDSYENRARELYLSRPDDFQLSRKLSFQHILLTVDQGTDEIAAMQKVIDVHRQLKAGAEFVEVARAHSDDPTFSENDGLYESIDPSELVAPLASSLSETLEGQLATPVRSQFGWHIARVVDRQEPRAMTWEEARPAAERVAKADHLSESLERKLRRIFDEPTVLANGALERLYDRYNLTQE